jgi:hypothetical protein
VFEIVEQDRRVAAVFLVRRGRSLPPVWVNRRGEGPGLRVVDGDRSDLRPLDPPTELEPEPVCVGLRYKPPRGRFTRDKPMRGRDVFCIPCEILDDDHVVVALSPRHTFALGEDALEDAG